MRLILYRKIDGCSSDEKVPMTEFPRDAIPSETRAFGHREAVQRSPCRSYVSLVYRLPVLGTSSISFKSSSTFIGLER
jgi:hypothetical protein